VAGDPEAIENVLVGTVVSARDGSAQVTLRFDPGGLTMQTAAAAARELALNILQGAEAADTDARFFRFMREKVGADDATAAMALLTFRSYRQDGET
jgi:hypothetical protein